MLLYLCKYGNNLERDQNPTFTLKIGILYWIWCKRHFLRRRLCTYWIRPQWIFYYAKMLSYSPNTLNLENLKMYYWWNSINTLHLFPLNSLPLNQPWGLITGVTAYRGQINMEAARIEGAIAQSPGNGWY